MLGDNIRRIRKSKKMSINKLSELSGVSLGYLSDIENNKGNPTMDKIDDIAIALGITSSELLTTEEKFEIAMDSTTYIHDLAREGLAKYNIDSINESVKENKIKTIAAHFDGEEFSDKDAEDIKNFINFILSKKQK